MELTKAEKRHQLKTEDYAKLAEFRYALRGFLRFSDAAAAEVGLTTQHYQAMLILRGAQGGSIVTIADLAQQLMIKHNSAVGLVDRLGNEGLAERVRSQTDKRKVELRLTPRGRAVLAQLAKAHRAELKQLGPVLNRFFTHLAKS